MLALAKRLLIWCGRFRHRCGYGVHSPSDFFLITSVIYEKYPFYAYSSLKRRQFDSCSHYRRKIYRLIFRIINYYQPDSVIDIACDGGRSIEYMKAASKNMSCHTFDMFDDDKSLLELQKIMERKGKVDCVHIGFTSRYRDIWNMAMDYVNENSIILVEKPYSSSDRKRWWKGLLNDKKAVVTFDLYDIGIVLFPLKRYKQNYIVNFL